MVLKSVEGKDEGGGGSWAGPIVAAAVILPCDFQIPENFGDSKQVKPYYRKKFDKLIKGKSIAYSIAEVSVAKINKQGIGRASQMAFRKCLKDLKIKPN